MNGELLKLTNRLIVASEEKDGMKNDSRILALTTELVLSSFTKMAEIGSRICWK